MRNKLLLFIIFISTWGMAQDFSYKRALGHTDSTWHEIPLNLSVLSKVKKDFSDIRIFSEGAAGDSTQVPFLLRKEKLVDSSRTKHQLRRISTTRVGNYYEIIFESSNTHYINSILLDFYDENYDWNIEVQGSLDRDSWEYLARDYRIMSIRNNRAHFTYNRVYFPSSRYMYYRVYIPTTRFPKLTRIHTRNSMSTFNKMDSVVMKRIQKRENKKDKTTEIFIDFDQQTPLAYLNFELGDKLKYYRRATISYLSDSTKNVNGKWMHDYTSFTHTILSSANKNEIYFPEHFVTKIKITIENEDNEPLKINSISGKHLKRKLIARFPETGSYNLYYGNPDSKRPKYDIGAFEHTIPKHLTELLPGKEITISHEVIDTTEPIIESKWWLWAIMGVILLLLVIFTLKMVKAK